MQGTVNVTVLLMRWMVVDVRDNCDVRDHC